MVARQLFFTSFIVFLGCTQPDPPDPYGAVPDEDQLAWHELEYYAFVHFNMNTFTGEEWGHGTESPEKFNPTQLDCRQWARVCREAGMKGIIITAKHHDGFCLWPSEYTEHSVKNSPWRDGNGDLLQELSDACREFDLKFGVYMSPWDRHNPLYGTPEYNTYFMKQLEEVLTNYGEVFEVWFDGANGEGPNGKKQVYDWEGFIRTVRKNQPNAVIFSDAGPYVRWIGNERGYARETNWCTLNKDDYFPGTPKYAELTEGNKNGTHWIPAEVNTSIRPGWYYHKDEDDQVKSPEKLIDIYYHSVGMNGNLLLNLPVDRRGRVHKNDIKSLMGLKAYLDSVFAVDLAQNKPVMASDVRSEIFAPENVTDGNEKTYWATREGTTTATLTIDLGDPASVDHIKLQEYIALGQRVESFSVDIEKEGQWQTVARGTTIGNRRILKFPPVETNKVRVNIERSMAPPTLWNIELYGP